jgi:hypothetical protein
MTKAPDVVSPTISVGVCSTKNVTVSVCTLH